MLPAVHLTPSAPLASSSSPSPTELEFVDGALSLCLALATTKAGADALLFGQRVDVPGGVVCQCGRGATACDAVPADYLFFYAAALSSPLACSAVGVGWNQLYHMQEGLASAWRSHLQNATSMKPYSDSDKPNLWHQAWRRALKIAAALVHVKDGDDHVQNASFSLAVVNLEPLQAALRW